MAVFGQLYLEGGYVRMVSWTVKRCWKTASIFSSYLLQPSSGYAYVHYNETGKLDTIILWLVLRKHYQSHMTCAQESSPVCSCTTGSVGTRCRPV